MTVLEALILGLIQGLTEFLPVSSSGHLFLGQVLLDVKGNEGFLFTIVVHFATALSTIVVFRKDIAKILVDLLKFKLNQGTRFSFLVVVSMIPAVIVGLKLEDAIDGITSGDNQQTGLIVVGLCLLITAGLLYFSHKRSQGKSEVGVKHAFIVGVAQAIATLPGISRSGATIATGLITGLSRENAARFSFLMVIPVIFGVMAKKTLDVLQGDEVVGDASFLPLIVGFFAAFISGWLACRWMISIVKKAKLSYFAIYCLAVGIISLSAAFFV
jgi:undecaprenyl-diphosphatase